VLSRHAKLSLIAGPKTLDRRSGCSGFGLSRYRINPPLAQFGPAMETQHMTDTTAPTPIKTSEQRKAAHLRGFSDAPERIRTSTTYSGHKALNLVEKVFAVSDASISSGFVL
jgi:hypothetical protein